MTPGSRFISTGANINYHPRSGEQAIQEEELIDARGGNLHNFIMSNLFVFVMLILLSQILFSQ